MGNDELEGIVETQLELGPEAVDQAVEEAFDRQAIRAYQTDAVTIPRPELYSISDLLKGVERVSPEARKVLVRTLLTKHYNVENVDDIANQSDYSQIGEAISLVTGTLSKLSENVNSYGKVKPYGRNDRKNLEKLTEMGLITDNNTYLAAMKNINALYGKSRFSGSWEYGAVKSFQYLAPLTLIGLTTAAMLGSIAPIENGEDLLSLCFASTFFSGLASCFTGNLFGGEYKRASTKHVGDNVDAVAIDLPVALNLAKQMNEQLQNPTVYNANYSKQQIAAERELGLQYFAKTIPLLEQLNDHGTI